MNTKVPCPKQRFLFPARQGLRISGKSLGMFFDDLGQKIGKIRYHDFQNRHFCNLGCIFEIKMMMKSSHHLERLELLLPSAKISAQNG